MRQVYIACLTCPVSKLPASIAQCSIPQALSISSLPPTRESYSEIGIQ